MTTLRMNLLWGSLMGLAVGLVCALIGACSAPPTPAQVTAGVDTACAMLRAFDNTPEVTAICATADELAPIAAAAAAAMVLTARAADAGAGARMAGRCTVIPTTTVCATDAALATGIRAALARRAKDGGG
jgi:hypothetical protein